MKNIDNKDKNEKEILKYWLLYVHKTYFIVKIIFSYAVVMLYNCNADSFCVLLSQSLFNHHTTTTTKEAQFNTKWGREG